MIKEFVGEGETISEAKQQAAIAMGEAFDDINFEVLELPQKKTLGLFGGKKAKVRAWVQIEDSLLDDFLKKIKKAYKLSCQYDITSDEKIRIEITGGDADCMIGRDAETLNSLQYLINLIVNQANKAPKRVLLNINNYREKQEVVIKEYCDKMVKRMFETGRAIALKPMSSFERRIVHLFVDKVDGITSNSAGEGRFRHVVLSFKKGKETNKVG